MAEHRPDMRAGVSFPDVPLFSGFGAPSRIEADVHELESSGSIPRSLNGRYYQIAYDWAMPPKLGDDVFVNGDGMAGVFRLSDGHADFKSRYVRTEKFRLERAARRALFGVYRNPFTDDPSVRGRVRGTANTSMIWHGGMLLALKEDSRPVRLDPDTLETVGEWDFDGRLTSRTFTAHPRLDPETGEMFAFGYEASGLASHDVAYYVIDPGGKVTHEVWFEVPYVAFMHDFLVTREHVVFPVFPTTCDIDRLRAGGRHWAWDPEKPTHVAVMPRYGTAADLRWYTAPAQFIMHFVNAYTTGPVVVVDGCHNEAQPFPFFYPDTRGNPFDPEKARPNLTRWTIDLSAPGDGFPAEKMTTVLAEMPSIDARYEMNPGYRFSYYTVFGTTLNQEGSAGTRGASPAVDQTESSLGRWDFEKREFVGYSFGTDARVQEPEFVPLHPDAPEGVGWVLALVNRHSQMRTDLVIFDAEDIPAGPVGEFRLPLRFNTVHGTWVPEHSFAL